MTKIPQERAPYYICTRYGVVGLLGQIFQICIIISTDAFLIRLHCQPLNAKSFIFINSNSHQPLFNLSYPNLIHVLEFPKDINHHSLAKVAERLVGHLQVLQFSWVYLHGQALCVIIIHKILEVIGVGQVFLYLMSENFLLE